MKFMVLNFRNFKEYASKLTEIDSNHGDLQRFVAKGTTEYKSHYEYSAEQDKKNVIYQLFRWFETNVYDSYSNAIIVFSVRGYCKNIFLIST